MSPPARLLQVYLSTDHTVLERRRTSPILNLHLLLRTTGPLCLQSMGRIPYNEYPGSYDHWQSFKDVEAPLVCEEVSIITSSVFNQSVYASQLQWTVSAKPPARDTVRMYD
jgi:hypothetical protein